MTAKTRSIKIDFTVREGYDTIITEGFTIPIALPMARAMGVIEMRLQALLDTAEYLNPTEADAGPIEATVTPS